ncbi:MAG: hypothetical protein IKN71_02525 [Alphaproteobacteria bacterium]|jgi:hypothetical protein|nr:hypothetical protein [Alphaproteobacteria bacterium]
MGKKKNYRFWRWLILTIVRVDKLYALTWGIVILLVLACIKSDLASLLARLML